MQVFSVTQVSDTARTCNERVTESESPSSSQGQASSKLAPAYWLPTGASRGIVARTGTNEPHSRPAARGLTASDPQTRAEALAIAARALRAAEHVCVLTGAGVSAESGIPTFRDAQTGVWAQFSPQELATPEAFASDPDRVWQWYAARRTAARTAQPNAAHLALVSLAARVSHCTLVTQNVDDLHQRAGSHDVVSLHGSLLHTRCSAGCAGRVEAHDDPGTSSPPACPSCGAKMRPDVVWFGETLPADAFEVARSAAVACDLFISIGTSNVVAPAASLPWLAASHGATVIVVNPNMDGQRKGPSILPLEGPAGVMLPRLVETAFAGKRVRQREQTGG